MKKLVGLKMKMFSCKNMKKPRASDEEVKDEAGGWTEVIDVSKDEHTVDEEKEEIVPDETIHEVAVGKGLSGVLKLHKERGTLKESIEWGGRNMKKKKSKLVGIVDDDEPKEPRSSTLVDFKKEIHIERIDEFGRGRHRHRHLGSHEVWQFVGLNLVRGFCF
ncbi:SART-1 family protein DOT2-like [Castanea sativa]|uniref:SART-1 family protein DOT2-like n=1 Tax=Castanea sativa TaxID=21020 RepID=UPI003F64BDD0